MGNNITVHKESTLGNRGPIYGEELYSRILDISGSKEDTTTLLTDISNLHIYNSTTEHHYTISGDNTYNNYFDKNIISYDISINTVNITQLVYTLVGAVKGLNSQIENQQAIIQDLTSRLTTLEST